MHTVLHLRHRRRRVLLDDDDVVAAVAGTDAVLDEEAQVVDVLCVFRMR